MTFNVSQPDVLAIIGSGYGDEGKGLVTDFLSNDRTRVVRFNGGAQAGHTVQLPDGTRHVFHHVGAGTFQGASTHLSRFFVVNPLLARKEFVKLAELGYHDFLVTVDPRALVTTPFDMMINQALEQRRGDGRHGDGRHGSCGIGFGETIERSLRGPKLSRADLSGDHTEIIARIRTEWSQNRCRELEIDFDSLPYSREIGRQVDARFALDCEEFATRAYLMVDKYIGRRVDRVVFEGAQGLGLDQDIGVFPHVTRSHTGLPNVMEIAQEADIHDISVVYVTRSYSTRHGAGPMMGEGDLPINIKDHTNQTNDWQGQLRTAPLNVNERLYWIRADWARIEKYEIMLECGLVVTCLDQFAEGGHQRFLTRLEEDIRLPVWAASFGPTADDVSYSGFSSPSVRFLGHSR